MPRMSSAISAKAAAVLEELRDKGESRPEFDAIIRRLLSATATLGLQGLGGEGAGKGEK
jgi:hypothetical protein